MATPTPVTKPVTTPVTTHITASDAVFVMTVQTLFNAPIILDRWSTSSAWVSKPITLAETQISLDGKLNRGFVNSIFDMTLNFAPNSRTFTLFDAVATASRQGQTVYTLNGELTLKGLNRKYTFINGVLVDYNPLPAPKGNVLGDLQAHLQWENVLSAEL
ncbi:hypothetical protein GS501_04980 [Saccharibacter sp. 17.LH.SD]|uniref:phage tail fiber protein n=1 Tax=Saccharibacter sp. 17.LH.SD TaxID=2689393 RepID=UPI00136B2D71|nr:hypothetical protein [Saccharibacter sp. 17.LH.SD]MXV44401.1 hypothetical protein [Saccharibacter sp. 17.LH.SD]